MGSKKVIECFYTKKLNFGNYQRCRNSLFKLNIIIDTIVGRKLAGIRASPCGGFLKLPTKIRQAFLSFCMMKDVPLSFALPLPFHLHDAVGIMPIGISRNCKRLIKVTLAAESVRDAKRSHRRP